MNEEHELEIMEDAPTAVEEDSTPLEEAGGAEEAANLVGKNLYVQRPGRKSVYLSGNTARYWAGGWGINSEVHLFSKDYKGYQGNPNTWNDFYAGVRLYAGGDGRGIISLGRRSGAGANGDIYIYDKNRKLSIHLNGASGDIRLLGADCAENFAVASPEEVEPGMVMVADQQDALRPCDAAYDKRVVGVVSGAGGLQPGVLLGMQQAAARSVPLALSGKVFCMVDAQFGPIEVGSLLTTSPREGYAMKAADPLKAFGAVVGKALRPLENGAGLVPIIVSLQ